MNEKPIELFLNENSTASPAASVIWLHGLGADGHDFVPVVEMLHLPHVRFILPHAPYRKVTVNNGHQMRAWYDLFGLTLGSREDEPGIRTTQAAIEALIAREIARGVPKQKIVLAGFSQGGAMALHTGLRLQQPLAGILALSTYLPLKQHLASEKSSANQNTPIFMAHGSDDQVISLATCRVSLEVLRTQQYAVSWHEYPMGHSVCMEEIEAIRTFLLAII
ncbi:MAG: alpha/beta hydrolase [Methylophilaceae bacterium]